jgi:hypothetical protein
VRTLVRVCAILFVVALPVASPAQQVVTLTQPAEFAEPFSVIAGVRELRDGRVIVVDQKDRHVKLIDFSRQQASMVGRNGEGPGEYRAPLSVFALPGDTSIVFDGGQSRLLVILPDGRPGPVISAAMLGTSGNGMITRFVPTRSDSLGRLYATGTSILMTPQGPQQADSVAIVRWTRGANDTEVIGYLRNRSFRDRGGDVDAQRALLMSVVPFIVGDQWAVSADGRVALLRYDNYRVDFVEPTGRRVSGSPISFVPVRVSEAHKAQWRSQEEARLAGSGTTYREPPRWPDYFPPFLVRPALFAPDGVLWVLRTGQANAAPTYDLIDHSGRLARRISLAHRSRVIGFSKEWIYVVRRDPDDVEYLQRYRAR